MKDRKNSNNNLSQDVVLCLPTFSLLDFLVLILLNKRQKTKLWYGDLSRYTRALIRLLRISDNGLSLLLSRLSGCSVQKIKNGDGIINYPSLHLKATATATTICEQLLPEIDTHVRASVLGYFIGAEPAVSYIAKHILWNKLWPYVLHPSLLNEMIDTNQHVMAVFQTDWNHDWDRLITNNLKQIKLGFYQWPFWYVSLKKILQIGSLLFKSLFILLFFIFKRGVTLKPIFRKKFKLIAEFYDPKRLERKPYDADFWIDEVNLKKNDVLFFFTDHQEKLLKDEGYTTSGIRGLLKNKGYELAILNDLAYSVSSLKCILHFYVKLVCCFFRPKSKEFIFLQSMFDGWFQFIEFLPLFDHYYSSNLIYLTIPNGRTGVRINDGIVTGLCRKHNIKSLGCQTRAMYAKKREYCFDCFDVYMSWGPEWTQMLKQGMKFVTKVIPVGCIYLDYLILCQHYFKDNTNQEARTRVSVSIFTGDISNMDHYTKFSTISFLKNCMVLAKKYEYCKFTVKTKDPNAVDIIMADKDFCNVYDEVKSNFTFVNRIRNDYADIMISSDIIIAMAFTTPGIEGLLLGKRVIYYNELEGGGQTFINVPYFIATNGEELDGLFVRALNDYKHYSVAYSGALDALDPFRDGKALARIHATLVES